MNILADRRKWLADRLRKVAAEEEAAGAKDIAADTLRRAREIEAARQRQTMRNEPALAALRPASRKFF